MDSKSKSKNDSNEGTGIAFQVNNDANRILTMSAKRAERAKKREAKLRLEDHLKRFPDWQM